MKYLFEWTPAISVEDMKIDAQHQRLLGEVNNLLSYVVSGKDEKIVDDSVAFLDEYITDHLAYEEEYMAKHKYPDIEKHIEYHKDFIVRYELFKHKLNDGVSRESLVLEIEQYIGNWWLNHIGIADKKYAEYIKTHALK